MVTCGYSVESGQSKMVLDYGKGLLYRQFSSAHLKNVEPSDAKSVI